MKRVVLLLFAAVLCIQLGCSGAAATQPHSNFPYQLTLAEGKELRMNRGEVAINLIATNIAEFNWEDGKLLLNGAVIRPFPAELNVVPLDSARRSQAANIPRVRELLNDKQLPSAQDADKLDVAYAIWMAEVEAVFHRAYAAYTSSKGSSTAAAAIGSAKLTAESSELVESVSTKGTEMLMIKFKGNARANPLPLDDTMRRSEASQYFPEDEAWKLVQSVETYLSRPGPSVVDLSRGLTAGQK